MYETPLTVVGRIITTPERRRAGDKDVVNFRIASNARYRNADGLWEDGKSLFLAVTCWGKLGTGVIASVSRGDSVIVTGWVHTNEYEDRDGNRRSSVELKATAVGPDLNRYIASIEKLNQPTAVTAVPDEPPADDAEAYDDADAAEPLPLSA